MFTLSRLGFYGQLLEQLNVALLSRSTVFLQCYSLLLLYCGQINDDDNICHENKMVPFTDHGKQLVQSRYLTLRVWE